jgi:hypothetical protein
MPQKTSMARPDERPEPDAKTLAEAVVKISDAMHRLLASGLHRHAIVVLLADMTKLPKRDIEYVLNGLEQLKSRYTVTR